MFGYSLGQLILEKTREDELRHTDWKNVIGSTEAYFVGYDAGLGLSHLQTADHPRQRASASAKDITQTPNK